MKKNISNKINYKLNFYINNDPEWGGTFQYTDLLIQAIKLKFNKKNIKYFYTNKVWKKKYDLKKFKIKLNFFQNILIQILVFFNLKKLSIFLVKIKILNLPKSFFNEDQYWIFPSQDLISVLCGGKSIVSINDLMHRYSNFPETSSYFRKKYRDYIFQKIAKHSYRVLTDSKLGKKHVINSYGNYNNIRVQYFSTTPQKFKNKKIKEKYIIYPAQFWEHKNHINLIYALGLLKKNYKKIKLILIGHKKKNYFKLTKLVKELNLEKNIKFVGYVTESEKANLIKNARALINASFLGPTNLPQLEAFCYGCPVILSNVFAHKEQCGNSVIYFNPSNRKQIANAIEKIWVSDLLYSKYKIKSYKMAKKYSLKNFSTNLVNNIIKN